LKDPIDFGRGNGSFLFIMLMVDIMIGLLTLFKIRIIPKYYMLKGCIFHLFSFQALPIILIFKKT
jgi:hypothetical protein